MLGLLEPLAEHRKELTVFQTLTILVSAEGTDVPIHFSMVPK